MQALELCLRLAPEPCSTEPTWAVALLRPESRPNTATQLIHEWESHGTSRTFIIYPSPLSSMEVEPPPIFSRKCWNMDEPGLSPGPIVHFRCCVLSLQPLPTEPNQAIGGPRSVGRNAKWLKSSKPVLNQGWLKQMNTLGPLGPNTSETQHH